MEEIRFSISDDIQLIILQFSFHNQKNVPLGVRTSPRETNKERSTRVSRPHQGRIVIPPTQETKIGILEELINLGFVLVDAFHKERIDPKKDGELYQMVRFTFVRKEIARLSDSFKKEERSALIELAEMCENALWRVRAFLNPYFKNGEVVQGKSSLSVNMEARKPVKRADGTPILYRENGTGELRSVSPVHHLLISGNNVVLS